MRYIIYGKNLEVTEGLKQAVHDKFSKLEKFFTPETEVQVTLSVQKEFQLSQKQVLMYYVLTHLKVSQNGRNLLLTGLENITVIL